MKFEYDSGKSDWNLMKHNIDFIDAQQIWRDPEAILDAPARSEVEPRWMAIGKHKGFIWAVIYTRNNDAIRIISARRARSEEKEIYGY